MNILKQLDQYLLRHFPNIWITKIHWVLPIGLLGFALIFVTNAFVIGYDTRDPFPDSILAVTFSTIAVIVGLVFWFVFQARYNVEKSGGELSLGEDYLNYFLYLLVFMLGVYFIAAVPLSNEYKMAHSIDHEELIQDMRDLNAGNAFANDIGYLAKVDGGYEFTHWDFVEIEPYRASTDKDKREFKTEGEALIVLSNYIRAYNKYTNDPIRLTPEALLAKRLEDNDQNYGSNQYERNYYHYRSGIRWKVEHIYQMQMDKTHPFISEKEFHFSMFAITGLLALLVWIFKQIHWRYYVYGLLALLLVPILVLIITVIVHEIFRFRVREDDFIVGLMVLGYLITPILIIRAYLSKTINHTAIVIGMFLQLYIPFAIFVFMLYVDKYALNHLSDSSEDLLYYASWGLGLLSIGLFKYFYQQMRYLPAKK